MGFMKLFNQIQKLGAKDPTKVAVACYTHLDLESRESIEEIECVYDTELESLYLLCKEKGCKDKRVYLPLSRHQNLNLLELKKIQNKFKDRNIILSICESSSTTLHYELKPGFSYETEEFEEKVDAKIE